MLNSFKKNQEIISGIIFLVFCIFYYYGITKIRVLAANSGSYINGRFFPEILLFFLITTSIFQIIHGIKKSREFKDDHTVQDHEKRSEIRRVLISILIMVLYVIFLRHIGFLIMTALYIFTQIIILKPSGKSNLIFIACLSIVTSAGIYLIFTQCFQMMLPRGLLVFI